MWKRRPISHFLFVAAGSRPIRARPFFLALSNRRLATTGPLNPRAGRKRYVRHPWNDSESPLSDDTRVLTYLAANTAAGNLSGVARDWCYLDPRMHSAGTDVILQTIVFAGVPKILNALQTVSELGIDNRNVVETTFPEGEEFKEAVGYDAFIQRGEAEMRQAYCHKYPRLRERMEELHPALDKWMVDTVYGRLRARPGLGPKEGQLCALAALAGNIVWPQFRSSIMVALNSGCTLEEVRSVLDQTERVWGTTAQMMVDGLWTDLNKKALNQWRDGPDSDTHRSLPAPHPPSTTSGYMTTEKHPFMYLTQMNDALPRHLRVLALLAAHTASGNLTRVGVDWSYLGEEYHEAGLEIILQTTIFGGFQKVINALQVVHNIGVSAKAINAQREKEAEDRRTNIKKGTALLQLIYQKQYAPLREKMRWMHPDVEKVIVEWAYGRVLARPSNVLAPKDRELCALACLSGQIVFPQLHSHILGALNAGARLEEIRAIFDQTEYVWGRNEQIMVDGFWLDFAQRYAFHKQQAAQRAKKDKP
jgi:4-carboxymuconolactone decarboxylase